MPAWRLPLSDDYTAEQRSAIDYPRDGGESLLLRGPAGTGKSTALVARLANLLREGCRPSEILVLAPQRSWVDRFDQAIAQLDAPVRGGVDIVTYYGLARREVGLFWPLVADSAGFAHPEREPVFLTIETAQYYMWQIVEPLLREEGYFSDLVVRRGRLLSQLIDNLNKAALVGFDYTTLHARLSEAWSGSPDHTTRYVQAQDCAIRFREHCLAHNLLDFSLVTEVYSRHLLPHAVYQRYFRAHYRHLLVDNLEENVPVAHDLVSWIIGPDSAGGYASAVVALDEGGGYRLFLGADPATAESVSALCHDTLEMRAPLERTQNALALAATLTRALGMPAAPVPDGGSARDAVLEQFSGKYWISMVRWAARRCAALVHDGADPSDIAILAPYVSDVMQFAIAEECRAAGIPLQLLRPSAELHTDPVIRGVLVLALLAHPTWEIQIGAGPASSASAYVIAQQDVALALQTAIHNLDPIRARLLAGDALPLGERALKDLTSASPDETTAIAEAAKRAQLWEEVGYQVREAYQILYAWLADYAATGDPEPFDLFLARMFGDVLSTPGFAFHAAPEGARTYGRLVESARKFREAVEDQPGLASRVDDLGREYIQLILSGIASAEYAADRPQHLPGGVILAPAYTYLTRDLHSRYQFWLDVGSDGWTNRPYQPLTQPYVLSRGWPIGKLWTDVEEETSKRENLVRVLGGLAARCSGGVYLAHSQLGIGGEEQSGRLARAVLAALSRKDQRDA